MAPCPLGEAWPSESPACRVSELTEATQAGGTGACCLVGLLPAWHAPLFCSAEKLRNGGAFKARVPRGAQAP